MKTTAAGNSIWLFALLPSLLLAQQPFDPDSSFRIASSGPSRQALTASSTGAVRVRGIVESDLQLWHFSSLGQGILRIHNDAHGRQLSLARTGTQVELLPTDDAANQLWRLIPVAGPDNTFVIADLGGIKTRMVLSIDAAGRLALKPCNWGTGQLWRVALVGRRLPPIFQQYQYASRQFHPDEPLPPATIDLVNRHSKEIWVVLMDRQQPDRTLRLKLPPDSSSTVTLERDAGGRLVEVFERVLPNGVVEREEFTTPIPPGIRYDVSVYEMIVQSIAIDRTVKGGKIEDVQYAPKSIGWFELPPGPQLNDGQLDVFAVAQQQANPGQVRRIDPAKWQSSPPKADPVEKLLEKYKK